MRGRTSTASIVASPVLVGAVTLLIVIVGVFLAYNANNGLPFVPTYDLKAELPSGAKLVRGNDVRVGGFRVGVVDELKPGVKDGKAIAIVSMKLEKTIEPLSTDTIIGVRPRSALGLKYVELLPGRSRQTYRAGDTIPLAMARAQAVEYEDLFSTFDKKTRDNSQTALKGFGDAFAGRGASINEAIAAFNPFFQHLTPVMQTLSAPDTHLENFFKNIGRASAEVVPVAKVQAEVFGKMAKTFEAFSACPGCLQQTIEKSPPTLQASIDSFKVQRPFLADFATLSKDLRPVVATLHDNLHVINSALETGIPVLKRTPIMNDLTGKVFQALDDLAQQPQTLLALKDLHTTFTVGRPLFEYVTPYQTVCDTAVSFLTGLSGHISVGTQNGTAQNALVKTGTPHEDQQNNLFGSASQRPADIPSNWNPQKAMDQTGNHLQIGHLTPYAPAVDAQGNADCQNGQYGYVNGPLNGPDVPYKPSTLPTNASWAQFNAWENSLAGGSHTQTNSDTPGLAGPTYVARRLGINNVKDVP
jgi:virulence factor Mce-like protein